MQIHELISKVAADIGVVGKSKRNAAQGYNFRSIDDVIDACHSALVKHGVTVLPVVMDMKREERPGKTGGTIQTTVLTVKYVFTAPDASFLEAVVIGEGMDSGDKSANKAMSAAYKYATGQVFAIPFSMDDSENDSPQPAKKQPAKPQNQEPKQPPKPPEKPAETARPATQTPEPKKDPAPTPETPKSDAQTGAEVAAANKRIKDLCVSQGAATLDEVRLMIGGIIQRPIKGAADLTCDERQTVLLALEEEAAKQKEVK